MESVGRGGQAPEDAQLDNPKLGGIFDMGGAAVANYVPCWGPRGKSVEVWGGQRRARRAVPTVFRIGGREPTLRNLQEDTS